MGHASGWGRPAPLRPGTAGEVACQGVPGEVGEEPVESPSAARHIGARCLHRIAYRRETTLQPNPVVAHELSRSKKALHHKQPSGHTIAALPEPERRRLESPYYFSPRPYITPVNING